MALPARECRCAASNSSAAAMIKFKLFVCLKRLWIAVQEIDDVRAHTISPQRVQHVPVVESVIAAKSVN